MGKTQIRLGVAGGLEFDGDHARYAAGVRRDPGEHQAVRGIDLEVFARVFDYAAVPLHHDAQPPADAKVDVGFDRADRRHPLLQEVGVRPPAEDLGDRARQTAVDLDDPDV